MADLSSLIRLHKHELDEKQREIGLLYDQLNLYTAHKQKLRDQREKEISAANENTDMVTYTLSGFLEKSKQIEAGIDARIFTLNKQIEEMRDEMLDSFAELKKYELTQAERVRLAEEEQKLKEGRMFDEVALRGFLRDRDE